MTSREVKVKHLKALEILAFIEENPGSSIFEVAKELGLSYKTAQRYLRELRGHGILIVKLVGKENIQRFYLNTTKAAEFNNAVRGLKRIIESIFMEE